MRLSLGFLLGLVFACATKGPVAGPGVEPEPEPETDPTAMCARCHDKASVGECQRAGWCRTGAGDCEAAGCAVVRSPPELCKDVAEFCVP